MKLEPLRNIPVRDILHRDLLPNNTPSSSKLESGILTLIMTGLWLSYTARDHY